jgi:hypothetical protein
MSLPLSTRFFSPSASSSNIFFTFSSLTRLFLFHCPFLYSPSPSPSSPSSPSTYTHIETPLLLYSKSAILFTATVGHSEMATSLYRYEPSLAVAIVAAALYSIAFFLTFVQFVRYKAWVWSIMVIAAASTYTFVLLSVQANPYFSGSCWIYRSMRISKK